MLSKFTPLVLITSILFRHTQAQAAGPTCHELVIPVTIKGHNLNVPSNGLDLLTTPNILSGLVQGIFQTINLFDGTYNIAGRYCEPENFNASRQQTLQLLLHPATYDRNYVSPPSSQWKFLANI
jgi:hypothetical protein